MRMILVHAVEMRTYWVAADRVLGVEDVIPADDGQPGCRVWLGDELYFFVPCAAAVVVARLAEGVRP